MDCDDQVWLVKRDNHSHADTPDLSRVTGLAFPVAIEMQWLSDHSLNILH
jgi:hypothetical protein